MDQKLTSACRSFIENRDILRSACRMESTYLYPVGAISFLNSDKKADVSTIKGCAAMLKERVNAFSSFRGTARLAILSMLASDEEPQKRLELALDAYSHLKKHFLAGPYLPLAAMIVSGRVPPERFGYVAERTSEIYELMRREHPFLTLGEDSVFSALLALSDQTPGDAVTEVERCYKLLKKRFYFSNAVQSLAHVLALCEGRAEDKCQKTIELYEAMRAEGIRYGTEYELATLGVLAMLPAGRYEIIEKLGDIDLYLSSCRGYGFWGLGRRQRIMHAAMILTSSLLSDTDQQLGQSTLALSAQQSAIAAAQQAAICAAIAAQAAASSSSH